MDEQNNNSNKEKSRLAMLRLRLSSVAVVKLPWAQAKQVATMLNTSTDPKEELSLVRGSSYRSRTVRIVNPLGLTEQQAFLPYSRLLVRVRTDRNSKESGPVLTVLPAAAQDALQRILNKTATDDDLQYWETLLDKACPLLPENDA